MSKLRVDSNTAIVIFLMSTERFICLTLTLYLCLAVGSEAHAQPTTPPDPTKISITIRLLNTEPLQPNELLLIYNDKNPASRELAEYYARVRGVPAGHLCPLSIQSDQESISQIAFDKLIRQPVRTYIEKHQLKEQLRCLVTFFGLPITVGLKTSSPEQQELLAKRRKEFIIALDELDRLIHELKSVGSVPASAPSARMPTAKDYPRLLRDYPQVRAAALKRSNQNSQTGADVKDSKKIIRIIRQGEGVIGLLTQLKARNPNQSETLTKTLQQAQASIQKALTKVQEILGRGLEDPARNEAFQLIRQHQGLIGLLRILDNDIRYLRTDETNAAVDSELSLLWWEDYAKYRWQPNLLNWQIRTNTKLLLQIPPILWQTPVMMVSRIDAPTAQIARRMIDQAIATERSSLTGKVYLDARGLKLDKENKGYVKYDDNLRELATRLRAFTRLPLKIDNRTALFGPGQCPQTMLYCGWYSLRKYIDAFDFVPGAVGYHLASFEAISLKNPQEQGWCKRMLEDGITATLGPVAEPYLESFPPPKDFLGLLLTGRFTLAECYAYTSKFNSWMMMLLGDPLYRPFAKNPHLSISQVYGSEGIPLEFRLEAKLRTGPASNSDSRGTRP